MWEYFSPAPLVAGGQPQSNNCGTLASAEIYNPVLGTWSQTGAMNTTRKDFTLTLLETGKVLAVGGSRCGGGTNNTAELYDPSTGTWEYTGNMYFHRSSHTAVLLTEGTNAGKVLVIAGDNGLGFATNTAELYDPITGTWASTGSLIGARMLPQAVVLNDGRVLVSSGQIPNVTGLETAELYDPEIGSWAPTGSLNIIRDGYHRMTVLPNGKVLLTGGNDGMGGTLASAERYNPANGQWNLVAPMSQARGGHTASMLPNGHVLVAGGFNIATAVQLAEIYDPVTDMWTPAGSLNQARANHTATVLQNGQVLLAGGQTQGFGYTAGAELFVQSCEITCPADIVTSTSPGQCGAIVNFPLPSTTGVCSTVTCTPPSDSFFLIGTTIVTCASAGEPNCTFTVTVNDAEAPTITCPSSITVSNDPGQCSAVVNYALPTATDNCSSVSVGCNPPQGAVFPIGATTVNCVATDLGGNSSSCSFTVTVNDSEFPLINCPSNVSMTAETGQPSTEVTFSAPAVIEKSSQNSDEAQYIGIACTHRDKILYRL